MQATKNKQTGRYQVRFRDTNGKQQQFSAKKDFPAGTTQRDANKIAIVIAEAHESAIRGLTRPYLSDCVDRMIEHLIRTKVKKVEYYYSHARNALKYDNDNTIDDIVDVCLKMRDDMLSAKKPDGSLKYSNGTIICRMAIFKRTANLAYSEWGLLDKPVCQLMKAPPKPKARERFVSVDECIRLIDACPHKQARNILKLFVLTGIRHGELKRMKPGDIFNNRITIHQSKNGKTRAFEISKEVMEISKEIEYPIDLTYHQLNYYFSVGRKKVGITNFKMHDLRHTFASWIAQSGKVDLYKLMQMLGHSSMDQTTQYAHLMPEHLNGIASDNSIFPRIGRV